MSLQDSHKDWHIPHEVKSDYRWDSDRLEERRIWLHSGGHMLIEYIPPEDDPWDDDDPHLGPQAA